jgi:hypothetical protein
VPRILAGSRKRLIVLDNPGLTAEKNQQMKERFLQNFGGHFDILR